MYMGRQDTSMGRADKRVEREEKDVCAEGGQK